MEAKLMIGAIVAAGLVLAACGDPAQQAARDHSSGVTPASVSVQAAAPADKPDPRDQPIPHVNGKPMWSANRDHTAEENAQYHFERNGAVFGAANVGDFVAKAHAFTSRPPAGTETLKRANGDTLYYDAKSNTFAVTTKDGAPRTLFKPDNGADYWQEQKIKEAKQAGKAKAASDG